MWPDSKRAVDVKTAAAIAAVARDGGATPVGVFVSENADAIAEACDAARLSVAQLHGDGARAAMLLLPSALQVSAHVCRKCPHALAVFCGGNEKPLSTGLNRTWIY